MHFTGKYNTNVICVSGWRYARLSVPSGGVEGGLVAAIFGKTSPGTRLRTGQTLHGAPGGPAASCVKVHDT